MPQILFDANLISESEINANSGLIYRLQSGELKYPNIKKLRGISYHHKMPTYRAKINDKERLIYTYVNHDGERKLCILAVNNHNYDRLKRQLNTLAPAHIDQLELQENEVLPGETIATELNFIAAVPHKQTMISWDEQQLISHLYEGSVIYSGPPGAGKTLVLYHNMLRHLAAIPPKIPLEKQPLPILFFSQSKSLLDTLSADYQQTGLGFEVKYFTWLNYLKSIYPGKQAVSEELFKAWLASLKWQENAREVHYELSLIVALGAEKYFQLGNRQCHFADNDLKKKQLVDLVKSWQNHLNNLNAFDPMICVINPEDKQAVSAVFCDETQNLPPAALLSLINLSGQFVASLDSEQCLLSSPYIHNCLKVLLYKHDPKYCEIQLAKTWRCPPEIIAVGNQLMNAKYSIDGSGNRRDYHEVQSTLPNDSGLASWVDSEHLSQLKTLCKSATTVVIVDEITEELRATIQNSLGTNNILRPQEAIGLEFENVILFNPISQRACLKELAQKKKYTPNSGLSLEQWNAFNALYVSLTRAQKKVYFFDDEALKRWPGFTDLLFGNMPVNQTPKLEEVVEATDDQWLALAKHHTIEGQIENARQVLLFHLKYSEQMIAEFIKAATSKETSVVKPIIIPTIVPEKTAENAKNEKIETTRKKKPVKTLVVGVQDSQPIQAINAQKEQRMLKIWSNFNQKELLSLFKAPDGMEILFNYPVGNFGCLFSRCLADKTKYSSLKKFIKDNGKLVAEKLIPHRLIEAKVSKQDWHQKPSVTITSLLYRQHDVSIIHELFEKYSPKQRVIFIVDSLAHSPQNQCLLSDKKILSLMSFNKKMIMKNLKELVDILCQPSGYNPIESYATLLCPLEFGISLIEQLIDEPAILQHIGTNLYKNVGGLSIFTVLSSYSTMGCKLLEKLYERDPDLIKKIKIENLLLSYPSYPCAFQSLNEGIEGNGHLLLKKLISPELAAKLPHGLPNDILPLFFLGCSNDGVKIIRMMVDAQPDMLRLMTGKVLSQWPETDRISIFSLLSLYPEGINILNRILDFHKEQFTSTLTKNAMYMQVYNSDFRGAYHWLQESPKGEQFLNRLRDFGWQFAFSPAILKLSTEFLPLPSQAALYVTSKEMYSASRMFHASPISILLWAISKGNEAQVIKRVSSHPDLLLQKGSFTDSLGQHYKNLTPLEYCKMTDNRRHFYDIMLNCLKSPEGIKIKRLLLLKNESDQVIEQAMGLTKNS